MFISFFKIQLMTSGRNSPLAEVIFSNLFRFINIVFGVLCLLFIGIYLDKIFFEFNPENSPLDTFNRIFPVFFIFDLIIKCFAKPINNTNIYPYLTLPIKRNFLFGFSFIQEMFSEFNLYIWFIILPFLFKTYYPEYGFYRTILFASFFYLGSLINSILLRHLKIAVQQMSWIIIFLSSFLILLEIGGGVFIMKSDKLFFNLVLFFSMHSWQAFFVILLILICLMEIFLLISKYELYASLNNNNNAKRILSVNLHFLEKIGLIGEYFNLYIRIIIRSNIFRWNIFLAPILFTIGLFTLTDGENITELPFGFRILYTQLMIGLIGFQFSIMFSLESSFFDGIMTNKSEAPLRILKYKYYFCILISFFITLILMLILRDLSFLFFVSSFFYVIGPISFILFQNALYNRVRIDLFANPFNINRSNSLLSTIIIMAGISFIVVAHLVAMFTSENIACYFMLILGIIVFMLHPIWLKNIYSRFMKRRYIIMAGFRKK